MINAQGKTSEFLCFEYFFAFWKRKSTFASLMGITILNYLIETGFVAAL
jgi:hypothetical protein